MATTMPPHNVNLQAPADDTMEISSDAGHFDGDIDIDFDHVSEGGQNLEDDRMLDDTNLDGNNIQDITGDASHEDLMVDDDAIEAVNVADGVMHEDMPVIGQDEELLDFSEDEQDHTGETMDEEQITDADVIGGPILEFEEHDILEGDEEGEQTQAESVEEQILTGDLRGNTTVLQGEHVSADSVQQSLSALSGSEIQRHDEPVQTSQEAWQQESQVHPQPGEDAVAQTADEAVQEALDDAVHLDSHTPVQEPHAVHDNSKHSPVHEEHVEQDHTAAVDDQTHAPPEQRASELYRHDSRPGTPTMTGLHPTVVLYDDNEVALFPSGDPESSEQYFLENENLVNASIGDLLQACRIVLADSITEDDELELGVEDLGLYISEDSTAAFSTSFSEMLEVFVQLHRLDGNEHPPPLYVTLSTKTRFTNRLSLLTQAVSEGKGFSQLPVLQAYEEGDDVVDYDEIDSSAHEYEDAQTEAHADDVEGKHESQPEQGPAKEHPEAEDAAVVTQAGLPDTNAVVITEQDVTNAAIGEDDGSAAEAINIPGSVDIGAHARQDHKQQTEPENSGPEHDDEEGLQVQEAGGPSTASSETLREGPATEIDGEHFTETPADNADLTWPEETAEEEHEAPELDGAEATRDVPQDSEATSSAQVPEVAYDEGQYEDLEGYNYHEDGEERAEDSWQSLQADETAPRADQGDRNNTQDAEPHEGLRSAEGAEPLVGQFEEQARPEHSEDHSQLGGTQPTADQPLDDDDFDEIDFDDDEIKAQADAAERSQAESSKLSPSAKRSWTEHADEDALDSEQESKKARAS